MGYPIILNGDHAEFERGHANTPPHERPDWPLPSFDARDWAQHFCKVAGDLGYKNAEGKPVDEGWMISWFANSLMRGFDEAHSQGGLNIARLEAALEGVIRVADRKTVEFDAAREALLLSRGGGLSR